MLEEGLVGDAGREVVDEPIKRALGWINRRWTAFGAISVLYSREKLVEGRDRRSRGRSRVRGRNE